MQELKLGLIQMNIDLGQVRSNLARAEKYVEKAAEAGVQVLILPELWTTGYALDQISQLAESVDGPTAERLSRWARDYQMCIVGGSLPIATEAGVANTTLVFDQYGSLVGQYQKLHLFKPMSEHQYLIAGQQTALVELWGWKCGLMICYDLRFPELARSLVAAGAEILFLPSEFPDPRLDHWTTLIKARAIENQLYMVGVNRIGNDKQNSFFGHSMVVGPWGELVCEGTREEALLLAKLQRSNLIEARRKIPCLEDRRPELY